MDPWGTPQTIGWWSDMVPFTDVLCLRSVRYDLNHFSSEWRRQLVWLPEQTETRETSHFKAKVLKHPFLIFVWCASAFYAVLWVFHVHFSNALVRIQNSAARLDLRSVRSLDHELQLTRITFKWFIETRWMSWTLSTVNWLSISRPNKWETTLSVTKQKGREALEPGERVSTKEQ